MLIEASAQHQHLRDLGSTKSGTDTITTLSQEKKIMLCPEYYSTETGHTSFSFKKTETGHTSFSFFKKQKQGTPRQKLQP